MKRLPIEEATDEQLRFFARDVQQIDKIPNTRDKIIAALVESGHTLPYIFVSGEEPDGDEPEAFTQTERPQEKIAEMPRSGFGYWRKSPMVICKILPTDRPGGSEPAHPTINGSPPLVIQRNMLVRIPYDFYLVLKQAGGTKIVQGEKPGDLIHTDYYEYPMVDVEMPSRKSIAEWQKMTADNELGSPKVAAA